MNVEEFPDILTAKHISEHLHLTKQQIYNLFTLSTAIGGIPNFKIGKKSRRVKRDDYLKWLSSRPNNDSQEGQSQ